MQKFVSQDFQSHMPIRSTILAGFIIASSCVSAQSLMEEVVVTASRSDQKISQISHNATSIGKQSLEMSQHTHINESLFRVSGVWINRGNGQEHLTALRSPVLTGAGGCGAFLMAQDGIPLRATGFCNVNELFESNSEQAERIEVIKGPGPAVYGSNAMHGIINIISPEFKLARHTSVSLESGPHDYYRTRLSTGNSNWRLDANGTTDGGFKDDSGFDQQKMMLRHHTMNNATRITSTFSYSNLNQETAGYIRGYESYKAAGSRRDNPNPEAFRDARSARFYSKIETQFENGRLVISPFARVARMEFLQHFLPGQALEKNGHTSIGVQSVWHMPLAENDWIIGLDAEYTRGTLEEFQKMATPGSLFLTATIPQGWHYDYEIDAQVIALFSQLTVSLGENTRLVAGVRLENVEYDYDNQMLDGRSRDDGTLCGFGGCRFNRPADRTDSFSNISPKIGIVHSLAENHQVYTQLSQGYRAPQTTELYRLQNTQSVSRIDSEEIDSLEIGFRGQGSFLGYDVSLYSMRKDNFIFRDTTRTNVDNGKTSHRGVEANLIFRIQDSLTLSFNASFARHQYENNPALSATLIEGNDIDTAPREILSARLDWQMTNTSSLELEWVHLGEYYEDPENLHEYEGHDLLNLRYMNQVSPNWSFSARLINLTDEDYAERADYGFGTDRYFIGEPASIYVSVKRDF